MVRNKTAAVAAMVVAVMVVACSGWGQAHPLTDRAKVTQKHKSTLKSPLKSVKPMKEVKERKEEERESSTISSLTSVSSPSVKRPEYLDSSLFRHQVTQSRLAHSHTSPTTRQEAPTLTETLPEKSPTRPTDHMTPKKTLTPLNASEHTPVSPTVSLTEPGTSNQPPVSRAVPLIAPDQTPSSPSPPSDPRETAVEVDYDGFFSLWEDLAPFEGETGLLGGDLTGERYVIGFRPPGF